MKLVFLKLSALLLAIVGIVLIGQYVQCPYICSYTARLLDGSFDVFFPGSTRLAMGIVAVLIGGYAFLPRLPKKKSPVRTVKQTLEKGVVEINLETLEKECSTMLRNVAPIKQLSIQIHPDKDNKKVKVEVTPEITITESQRLPDIEEKIIESLEGFMNTYFGLSIALPIMIKIDNVKVNSEVYSSLGQTPFDTYTERSIPGSTPPAQIEAIPSAEHASTPTTTTAEETKDEVIPVPPTLDTEVKTELSDTSTHEEEQIPEGIVTSEEPSISLTSLDSLEKEQPESEEKSYLRELIHKLEEDTYPKEGEDKEKSE